MGQSALDIQNLSYAVRGFPILREVSVAMNRGESWSIIGANGAGKSTLLKCLLRINRGWSGGVRIFDQPLKEISQKELARRVAYVPQPGGDQRFPYTVREFIRMSRYPYSGPFGSAHSGDQAAMESALDQANVSAFADRQMGALSGGERQKVFIAAALAQGGDLLLLDEPTAFLDYRHQAEVSDILHRINRESGVTIVTVTHDVNAAFMAGGHILALREGRAVWSGLARDLACEKQLSQIFDATFRFIDDPETGLRLVAPQGGWS